MPCKQYGACGLQQHLICTEDVTAVRRTLQRLLNGKSLDRAGFVTEEVVLCSVSVDDGGCSQDQSQEMHGTSLYCLVLVPHFMDILL